MSLQQARKNVKAALTSTIIKSIIVGVLITIVTTAVCFFFSPTSLFLPLLLQGEYLAAFIRMFIYTLGVTLLDLATKYSNIREALELLERSK